ncbi:uncharacterized protein F4822DRAFT_60831 [Hypoxylon trugodes]|uniref:uncharacterized protein n=1 Tax=Hypoxylon trugodes TaxID=326681 RepID=UPI0021971434|nr:uncharacterized protein F4822DRAFT_60831 [Hypoxylon trugodes]KAI1384099.1 hypothetical protein F4822DRAFT_60831 [Hypoxylon trugodes]
MMTPSQDEGHERPDSPQTSSSQAPLKLPQSATHRAPFFSDLDEAFRKITLKKSSNGSNSQQTSNKVESSRDNLHKEFASLTSRGKSNGPAASPHDVAVSSTNGSIGRSLTDHPRTLPPSSPTAMDMALAKENIDELTEVLKQKATESKATEPLDTSANTVEKIFDDYASSSPANNVDIPTRDGAVTRCGFRGEEERGRIVSHRRFQVGSPPSDLPESPTRDLRLSHRRSRSLFDLTQGSSLAATTTISDSQHLLNVDAQANELEVRKPFFPSPLRLPPKKFNPENSDEFYSDFGSSPDIKYESSDDPFKYDEGNYRIALRNTKEKEVSQALRRVSKLGEGSGATIGTPEDSFYDRAQPAQALERKLPIPPQNNLAAGLQSKRRRGSNFQRAAAPLGYKTSVHDNRQPDSPPDKFPLRDSTGGRDWITEATSEVDIHDDTNPFSPVFKVTGSSVADSFNADDEGKWPGKSNGRARFIQHPVGQGQPESYELQTLKDTNQRIILPKNQPNRAVVHPDNSTRWFSVRTKEIPVANRVRNSLTRGLSNPFARAESYKKADLDGNFKSKVNGTSKSKYEFRDSASDYGFGSATPEAQGSLEGAGLQRIESEDHRDGDRQLGKVGLYSPSSLQPPSSSEDVEFAPSDRRGKRAEQGKQYEKRHVDEDYPVRNGYWWRAEKEAELASRTMSSMDGPSLSAKSKFDFELIPLDQAQRQKKQQRESGEIDETEPAGVRYKRAMSSTSNRVFQDSSPISPPLPIHARRGRAAPEPSIDLSPGNRRSYLDIFQELSSPFSATSGPSLTPASSRPKKFLGQNSSPTTPASSKTGLRVAKRSWVERYKPQLMSTGKQGRRIGTDQTVVRHFAESESGLSAGALEALAEVHISENSCRRRKYWFILMAILGILFPFIAVLVLAGKFNECLTSYTRGEVRRLTIKQRNFIRNAFLFQCCLYTIIVSAVIAVYTKKP